MALDFPNPSRSYDATLRAVRFWGHDGAMEASFFVNRDVLQRIQPGIRLDEGGLLRAFDCHRDLIHATAAKVHRRGRKALYAAAKPATCTTSISRKTAPLYLPALAGSNPNWPSSGAVSGAVVMLWPSLPNSDGPSNRRSVAISGRSRAPALPKPGREGALIRPDVLETAILWRSNCGQS